ncbi:unnamed protein product [Symbiodinium natans]|uniref:Uncharacterized protein n=1 Tax=Symbiodinium natans TaxID=878477 RepID=A0A812M762_9DINO|nr:unnamed protein product [Symbiodinium natans]
MELTGPTEPMELTEPMEPMELTEPMEPMEPAEPMEEGEQEEEMEPRRKEIKIHRVGMGKGYGSSASSAAEGSGSAPSYMPPKPKKKPERPVVEGRDYIPLEGGEPDGPVEIGSPSSSSPETTMVYQEAPPTPRRAPRTLSSGHIALELQEQQVSAEQRRSQFGFQSQEGHRHHQRAQNQSKLQSVHRQDKNELQSVHLRTQCRVVRNFLFTRWTGNPATQQWRNTSAGMRKSMLQDVPVQFLQETKQEPGNPRNLLVELHTFGPGTASEAKAVEQRVPAETRGLGPYNPGRGLGPYNPGWKMRELNQGAVPEDHLRRNDLLEARKMTGEIGQDDEVDYQKEKAEVYYQKEKAEIDYQEEKTEIDYQEESKFYGLCTNKSLYSDKTMNGTRDPLVMWIWTSIPGAKNLYDPKTMQFDYNGAMAMMLMLGVSGA